MDERRNAAGKSGEKMLAFLTRTGFLDGALGTIFIEGRERGIVMRVA